MAKVGEYPDYISRPDDEEAGLVECKVYGKQEVLDVVRGMPAGTRDPLIFDEDQIVDIDCLRQFEHQRPTIDDTCPPMDQVTQSFALMSCGQHDYLRNFLWKNWKLSMDPVLSNGNCLFAAIRQNLNLRRTGWPDQPFFPNRYLRRQVVVWLAENSQLVLEKFGVYLKGEYGVKGELLGDFPTPVSYTQYLLAQLKNGTWGDLVVLYACSCMWDFRVTVLTAAMVEWRFRHNLPLGNTDMAILHSQNHFSTLLPLVADFPEEDEATPKKKKRPSRSKHKFLVRVKRKTYTNMTHAVRCTPSEHKANHPSDTEDSDDVGLSSDEEADGLPVGTVARRTRGKGAIPAVPLATVQSNMMTAKRAYHKQKVEEHMRLFYEDVVPISPASIVSMPDVPDVLVGPVVPDVPDVVDAPVVPDVPHVVDASVVSDLPIVTNSPSEVTPPAAVEEEYKCTQCSRAFDSINALRGHLTVHTGQTGPKCLKCSKVYANRDSLRVHQRSCGVEATHACIVEGCDKRFKSVQLLASHSRQHTTNTEELTCVHCGRSTFTRPRSRKDHEKDCQQNPNRQGPYTCKVPGCGVVINRYKDMRPHVRTCHK